MVSDKFKKGQIFQHIDGGFYQFEKSVLFADDGDELVIYAHIWPFPRIESARRAKEFLAKFKPIMPEELAKAQEISAVEFQEIIKNNKANRKKAS